MLLELHVKNLALIEKSEVSFTEGLNILTGETGAGKSIIIGSVGTALGQKAARDMIREGQESAYIELVFLVEEEEKREKLKELGIEIGEDHLLILSRRITEKRSISKINDMTVTAAGLRRITGLLIDIHGQHEHQSLLDKAKHLEILDLYAREEIEPEKKIIAGLYSRYQERKTRIGKLNLDRESRLREADFLRFEIEELENADLKEGEEEKLTAEYRMLQHSQKITGTLSLAGGILERTDFGQAIRELSGISSYDEQLKGILDQLYDADAILSDAARDIRRCTETFRFDEEAYDRIGKRLDLIHNLQAKYGSSIPGILKKLEEKEARLQELEHFDEVMARLVKEQKACEQELDRACRVLSQIRQEAALSLTEAIRKGLNDLNFIDVRFTMEFRRLPGFTAGGYDEAEFMISTNPGLPIRPLGAVASGGELSRIMLAIKAVLADSDEIPTLIFDEIDTGISGRTAQKVSEKLAIISKKHQVICITHLPQIAAMADSHYEIVKSADSGFTTTNIHRLGEEEMIRELARMLGGAEITDAVYDNAAEMKKLACERKRKERSC